jgi:hypothetical protein
MIRRTLLTLFTLTILVSLAPAGTIFVGLEGSSPPTMTTDLTGFPNVDWIPGFSFDVSGAASLPSGEVYLCEGAFTTHLYLADMQGHAPVMQSTISVDISGLAYGRDTLYGYSNYATPKGIYAIDPTTGDATLVVDVYTGTGFRFFALDYNPADDLLYGYTEYGNTGLYSINLDTGEMIEIVDPFPASNSSGRAMAVGNNTVYVLATRGDDGVDCYAYDLDQGIGGEWVAFTNPYPQYHATGGAAFIHDDITAAGDLGWQAPRAPARLIAAVPNPFNPLTRIRYELREASNVRLTVYNLAGRRIRVLRDGVAEPAGQHEATWDGRSDTGRAMPSGTYLYRLEVGDYTDIRSMALVR